MDSGQDTHRVAGAEGELAQEVGQQHQDRAGEGRGQQQSPAGADHAGRDGSGQEGNEGDGARRGGGDRPQDNRAQHYQQADGLDPHAQRDSNLIAQSQHFESVGEHDQDRDDDDQGDPQRQDLGPGRAIEAASQPTHRGLHVPFRGVQQQVGHQALQHGCHADADQDEPGASDALTPGQQVDDAGRGHPGHHGDQRDGQARPAQHQQREDRGGYYQRLADAGFTVVSVGYSLAPEKRYPTAVHQLNDAHAYLLEHAEDLLIDVDRIVLAGDSAGAQLSAQLATAITNADYAAAIGITPALPAASVRGLLLNCGIYNVPAMDGSTGIVGWGVQQALWAYTGTRDFAGSEAARMMSSHFHVTADFPPIFITGGNGDPLTNTQSKPLADKLTGLGVEVDSLFYPDEHEPSLPHEYQFDLSLADARAAYDRTVTFAKKVTV